MSETSGNLAERQEEEVEVLQAIFSGEEFQDLRHHDKWKVRRPPEVKLTLRPQESMHGNEAHVSLELWIKCSSTYPEEIPELKIQNVKGISNDRTKVLQEELEKMAKKLKGEVMILELAQHVQHFLHAHNRPPTKSFYEEMMVNQKQLREKQEQEELRKLQLMKKREEKQLLHLTEEIKRREEALREEGRRRREESRRDSSPAVTESDSHNNLDKQVAQLSTSPQFSNSLKNSTSPTRRRRTSTPRCAEDDISDHQRECVEHKGTTTLTFSNKKSWVVTRGRCLGHSERGSTVYSGIDSQTGDMVAIIEWIIKWRHGNRKLDPSEKTQEQQVAADYIKFVITVEQELLSLCKLRHKHLAHYLAINYTKDMGRIVIQLLQEYGGGTSLESYLTTKTPVGIDQLRYIVCQLLEALQYLHSKSVVHKSLRASSVHLDAKGSVRLNDYSIDRKLGDLVSSLDTTKQKVHFADDVKAASNHRYYSKKDDIFKLGQMMLSLAEGTLNQELVVTVPTSLPNELHDFISRCVAPDGKLRWTASQLQDHSFIKSPILTVPVTCSSSKQPSDREDKASDDEEEEGYIPYIPGSDFGQSRLKNEFEILKWLGKGGFGDVIKVRNKLDGRFYAIKRIQLNTKSKQFTKKITREVKLLSRLNHEGVVRYYNSWIETSSEEAPSDTSTDVISTDNKSSTSKSLKSKSDLRNSLDIDDDIEKFAPAPVDVSTDWSMSASNPAANDDADDDEDSSSDEDDDEDDDLQNDVFGASFLPINEESDDGIVFGDQSANGWEQSQEASSRSKDDSVSTIQKGPAQLDKGDVSGNTENGIVFEDSRPRLQFLYIQMEFCEKSTLRQAIDNDLYQDMNRVWRYLREVLEGLAHIHEQGMIHRDLKPSNIFIDSSDHVRIGDFGLATTDIISKQQSRLMDLKLNLELSASADLSVGNVSQSESLGDGNLTGKVGSALYVSPEMLTTSTRTFYNQKVDIYSMGVMFFEMCYRPLKTGMERVKILSNLRKPTIELPEDFEENDEMINQIKLIRMMLTHDVDKRPLTEELLQSDLLPPPVMEESELNEVLRSTIANPESRAYKLMVHSLHSQPVDPATDFTYDLDMHQKQSQQQQQYYLAQMRVMESLEEIFQCHGAVRISTPLLMPRSSLYENTHSYVCLMDHSGTGVSLPFDLRVPFARYIARNNIHHLKRYNIERVYREKRLPCLHPMERTECAFDIVTTTPIRGVSEAEVLQIVDQVINEYSVLQSRGYYIRINHVDLLRAILLHCEIPEEKHQHVLAILCDNKGEKGLLQLRTRLYSLSLSDDMISKMLHFMEVEDLFGKVASMLQCITKSRDKTAGSLAKRALKEMEDILSHLQALGCKLQVFLTIGLVYNFHMSSGAMFHVVAKVKKKRKEVLDVLAAGGRYDTLIKKFQRPGSIASHLGTPAPAAVGVSFQLEKLVNAVLEQDDVQENICDVLVCSVGHHSLVKEKLQVLKHLWSARIRADIFHDLSQSLEEIQDYCRKVGIPHVVVLKDLDTIRVQYFERERKKWTEKKILSAWSNMASVIDHIKQNNQSKIEVNEVTQPSNKSYMPQVSHESNISSSQSTSSLSSSYTTNCNITFVMSENSKLSANARRRMESPIFSNVSAILTRVSNKVKVEIIAVEVNAAVIKTIAAYIELDENEKAFEDSIGPIIEKHTRYKKYLTKVFDLIHDLRFNKKCSGFLLYGIKDDSYKLLLAS